MIWEQKACLPLYHVKFIWFYRTKIYKWDFWQKLPLKKDMITIPYVYDRCKKKHPELEKQ